MKQREVILRCLLVGGDLVAANVAPDNQARRPVLQPTDEFLKPPIVETHPVDQAAVFFEAEKPRFRIARLRLGGNGTYLNKGKTHGGQLGQPPSVFVEPRRQTYSVREPQARHFNFI